jgi:hypothetical protein
LTPSTTKSRSSNERRLHERLRFLGEQMRLRHDAGHTYDRIAQDFGLPNRGTAWRIARYPQMPYNPSEETCKILNLPIMRLAPACNKCGKVHVTSGCREVRARKSPKDLFAWSTKDLLWALENRVEWT